MKNRKITFVITVFSMLLCLTTFAQGPPGGGQGGRGGRQGGGPPKGEKPNASEILKLLDINNDDKIDKDEAAKDKRGKISEDFDTIDANEDGFIDLEELEASLDSRKPKRVSIKKLLKEVDQDEDGQLNELEVAAKDKRDLMANFSEIDVNGDSQLDIEELKAFYSKDDKKTKNRKE
ncbi:EF hand domain-containing protein [Winogradskyella eximia]|uniref:EF hand domain-containing protein n=2 Tax=Winogradskyella eximia TaxID=262006 RepID=A0A3D9GZI7_9FLAO|nr:EF-hand domain-containing protein [Winogradskyella eximia]RED42674.1 EF hand domain-containing protein [Winogradskyella eximia]